MKKVILKKDIVLTKKYVGAGSSGELIIEQDAVGGHLVKLVSTDSGFVDVSVAPHAITVVHWSKDDERTYWYSIKMTSDETIPSPSTITNLVVEIVDTISAKIKFNAPQGFTGDDNVKTDLYYLILSESNITSKDNQVLTTIPITPKRPNDFESYIIPNLKSGQRYYVSVLSVKSAYGVIRYSELSNIVTFVTTSLSDNPDTPKRIPIYADKIYQPLAKVAFEDGEMLTNYPTFSRLGEVQGYFIDNNGTPSGLPPYPKVAATSSYGTWDISWYNIGGFYKVYFELDAYYTIDYVYCLFGTNNRFKLFTSSDGINLIEAFDKDLNPLNMYDGWVKVPINNQAKSGVKYIILGISGGASWYNGFIPYGTKESSVGISGKKYKNSLSPKPLAKMMGTNLFAGEQQMDWVSEISNYNRLYTNADWLMSGIYRTFGVVSTDPNDIQMNSALSHIWNWETKFQEMRDNGIEDICITLVSDFVYLRDTDDSSAKPLNKGLNQYDLAVTTNPHSYSHASRIIGALAYRWGYNTNAPDVYDQFIENDGKKGLGYVKYYEFGNERDRYWNGATGFFNPEEMAAYLSALWDGHKGALGIGFGLQGADPNAVLVMPGMFFINTDYIRIMKMWWDVYRGKGDYPIKFLNFHHYNAYSETNDLPNYAPLSIEAYALMPEEGELIHRTKILNEFRSLEMPNCHIGVTEFGYDEAYKSVLGFDKFLPIDRAKFKAYGLIRSYMIYNSVGLDIICQYVYGQTGQANAFSLSELGPQQVFREKFTTCMLTEGIEYYNSFNRKRLLPFWYVAAFKKELEGYIYTHTVMEAGMTLVSESNIVADYSPDTWIFAFEHINDNTNKILIAWKAVDDYSTYNLKLRVNNVVTLLDTINFTNQHIKASVDGTVNSLIPTIEASSKFVTVSISALPVIIKSTLVGTKLLETPVNLKAEPVNATSIKLAWTDKNIGTNKTRVYISNFIDSGFVITEEEYKDNAETTIANLLPNTTYYFRIQFTDGTKVSSVTQTVSAKTSKVLVTPSNLSQTTSTASTITLAWTYPILEEANITHYKLYRSTSVNGNYVQIALLASNLRSYIDTGLVASTSYYYKMQAYAEGSLSAFTFAFAGTTSAPSYAPPFVVSSIVGTTGTFLEVVFNEELKDEQTAITAFTIVESYAGRTIIHTVTSISINPADKTKVILSFDIPIFKAASVTLSYSASIGGLQSVYNYPVNTFYNYTVQNNVVLQYSAITSFTELSQIQVSYNTLTALSIGSRGVAQLKIVAGQSSIIQWNVGSENGILVGLDVNSDAEGYSTMDYVTRKYAGKQEWRVGNTSGLSNQTLDKGLMRFKTDGTNLLFQHSTDGGSNWITVHSVAQPNSDLYLKFFGDEVASKAENLVGINVVGTSPIIVPDAPTNMVINDDLDTISFTPNPAYALSEHEYTTNYSSYSPSWAIVPSNPLMVGDVNIPSGNFAIRVREATNRTASVALVSTTDITGSINSSSPIFVQKSNGSTVLFGCTTLTELSAWLATANITQDITIQFNTQTTYLLTAEFNPSYNNGTNWVTFQGAVGVRPAFDVQQLAGTVWNIRSYTILRNMELRNANLEAAGATLVRADQRHHCKFFDIVFDYGFCCIRGTDGGMAGMGVHNFEVDNVIVRNVWGGSFRLNAETTMADTNMSFKNIYLDNVAPDSEGKGATLANSTRKYSPVLVLKTMNNLLVENIKSLTGDYLYDMGEIENCNDVVVRNVRGRSIMLLGDLTGSSFTNFQPSGKNFKLYNCYFPNVGSYMHALDGLDMVHCQFKLFIYECKNLGKFRGNIFPDGLYGQLMSSADIPVQENNNLIVANSVNDRYVSWTFPSEPDYYVTEANKDTYKATRGQNTLFIPYANRNTINQNPFGSLRTNSVGKGLINGVLESTSVDIDNLNRVYPTDPGPFSGLRPDQNDQPEPPTVTADNLTRVLVFSHPLGISEILYNVNGGAFVQYTGAITVADTAISANYYTAKIKAASYRNESSVVGSPEFTAKPVDNTYQVIRSVEINFKGVWSAPSTDANINNYAPDPVDSTSYNMALIDNTGVASGITIGAFETGFVGNTSDALPTGSYIRSEQAMRTALELNNGSPIAKLKFTGLDNSKFYQLYIVSCSQYSGHQNTFIVGSKSIIANTGLSYPYDTDGEYHVNPAVTKLNDIVPVSGEFVLEVQKTGAGWQGVAINYLIIEETNKAKPS